MAHTHDFARTIALNTPLRQTLGATPKFTDVSGSLAAMAEAVTQAAQTCVIGISCRRD